MAIVTLPAVYVITFATGHFYIGSTNNLYQRIKYHRNRLKNDCHDNKKLQAAFTEWDEGFVTYTYCKNKQVALDEEQRILDVRFEDPLCCNFSPSAKPSWVTNGAVAAAAANPNKPKYWLGKNLSEEAKRKIGDANRLKVRTEEHRRNQSIGQTGKILLKKRKPVELDGVRYSGITEASLELGIFRSTVARRISGQLKGFPNWKFVE